jgi:hypothetical protein
MKIYMIFCAYLTKYLSERKIIQTEVEEKNETCIWCPVHLLHKSYNFCNKQRGFYEYIFELFIFKCQ